MLIENLKLPLMSLQQLEAMFDEISNWGRWGDDDELGTLNLITPEITARATALVEHGVSVSLAANLDKEKSDYNGAPFEHSAHTTDTGNHVVVHEKFSVSFHGSAHSHIDSLNHITYKGKSYNGFSEAKLIPRVSELGIHTMADGIVSRGVLVDVPWLRRVGLP